MIAVLARQLADLVGADHLIDNHERLAAFAVHGRTPLLAVAPGSLEELAQTMAAAHGARMPVVPYGGGTLQSWGRPLAVEQFIVVQTGRLQRVLVYEPDDLTISVEAGMTMAALETTLAANGQMLPLDGPLPERSTIGGLLASGIDGPRRLAYGTARDLLIGIGVVEATGRISKAGGLVVKNVSGFDMMKLYLGSLGSLAIIASANFKLIPRPHAAATVVCSFARPEQAFALARAIHESQLTPAAVEYLDQLPGEAALGAGPALYVRAEGLQAAVERHVRDLQAMAEEGGAQALQVMREQAEADLWRRINDLAWPGEPAADELTLRLSCLPAELPAALVEARSYAEAHGLELQTAARALSGIAYLRLRGDAGNLRLWHGAVLARRPQLILTGGAPGLVAELPVWGAPPANLELMSRIKQEFDPENLLNPGRFLV